MGKQGKPRRIRRAAALAGVIALTSSLAAQALDAGSLLAPILSPSRRHRRTGRIRGGAAGAGQRLRRLRHRHRPPRRRRRVDWRDARRRLVHRRRHLGAHHSAVNSELGRVALPVLPAKGSYGQGLGLGVGLGLLPGVSTNLFGSAVAKAPPSSAPVEQEAAPVTVAPLAHAAPFRARAQALSSAGGCVLGSNLAYGQGNAADLSLVGLTGPQGSEPRRHGRRPALPVGVEDGGRARLRVRAGSAFWARRARCSARSRSWPVRPTPRPLS